MKFDLTEDQRWLKQNAREFFQRENSVTWAKMAEQGWMGLMIPIRYGGLGLGFVELTLLLEEMGYALAPGPFLATVVLGGSAILAAGNERQKREFLPRIARGELRLSLTGLSPEQNGVIAGPTAQGGDFSLEGRASAVLEARDADWLVVSAADAGPRGTRDAVSLFLVEGRRRGLTISKGDGIDQTRHLYGVRFSGVKVSRDRLLGKPGRGRTIRDRILAGASAALAAEMAGGALRILDMCVSHARQRFQFGKAIGSFQAIQHSLADMKVNIENARSLAYHAAWAVARNAQESPNAAAMAKAYGADAFLKAATEGIQIHGAAGFASEHDIHRYLRRALLCRGFCGDGISLRERVAQYYLDLP